MSVSERRLRPPWFVRSVVNPLVMWLGGATTLAVEGRTSGQERTVPVNVLEHGGQRYLVSPRGEGDWVMNLRAAGGGELRRRRSREAFSAVEVPVAERPELIEAYRRKWDRATRKYFEALSDPADHPTFRVDPRP
jgi:deazaflavin-dependent oxidoreductase (nitroreductase family)